jgi:glycerol-3-phosphate cytidylyltransferase-like family protein
VVFVSDPPKPLLPAQARAELVAALNSVDAVVASGPVARTLASIREEEADEFRFAELVRRVHERNAVELQR